MSADNGGPAFPAEHPPHSGMTLRDWFAGQAMSAIIIGNKADRCAQTVGAALDAYAVADAMLAARRTK